MLLPSLAALSIHDVVNSVGAVGAVDDVDDVDEIDFIDARAPAQRSSRRQRVATANNPSNSNRSNRNSNGGGGNAPYAPPQRLSAETLDEYESASLAPIVWPNPAMEWRLGAHSGEYHIVNDGDGVRVSTSHGSHSTVVRAKCGLAGSAFDATAHERFGNTIDFKTNSEIMREIQKAPPAGRQNVFVLPSQLNAAEYATEAMGSRQVLSYSLNDYLYDNTGGPRGQLACDLGIAQFILQNASNVARPNDGINNVRAMGAMTGISIINGYLQVPGAPAPDVSAFHARLPEMEVLGMRDVKACGLRESFPLQPTTPLSTASHTVDLIYASAAPIGSNYNNPDTPLMRSIANGVLLGQYTAALRLAIQRGNCDVYLMPLGGGVFKNNSHDIKSAIVCAIEALQPGLAEASVRVGILTFHMNNEHTIYR